MAGQINKKKKISLNTVGFILLVVILVACYYVWQAGNKAHAEVSEVTDNLTIVQAQSALIVASAADLSSRLESVKAELAAAQADFPASIDRNEVIDYILTTAADYNIQILPINTEGIAAQNMGTNYQVLQLTAIGEGSLKDVESFMNGLQDGDYPTLVITSFTVTRNGIQNGIFPGEEMPVAVNMKIAVYAAPNILTEDSFR